MNPKRVYGPCTFKGIIAVYGIRPQRFIWSSRCFPLENRRPRTSQGPTWTSSVHGLHARAVKVLVLGLRVSGSGFWGLGIVGLQFKFRVEGLHLHLDLHMKDVNQLRNPQPTIGTKEACLFAKPANSKIATPATPMEQKKEGRPLRSGWSSRALGFRV